MKIKINKKNTQATGRQGFIALSTVLILTVVALSIITTVSLLGIGQVQSSLAHTKGETTLALVEGCVDLTLLNVRNNADYLGGSIPLPEGTCTVTVNSGVLTTTMTYEGYSRTIRVAFTRGSSIILTSWQEI